MVFALFDLFASVRSCCGPVPGPLIVSHRMHIVDVVHSTHQKYVFVLVVIQIIMYTRVIVDNFPDSGRIW